MGDHIEAAIEAAQRALSIAETNAVQSLSFVSDDVMSILERAGLTAAVARAWWAHGLAFRTLGRHPDAYDALTTARGLLLGAGEIDEAHRVSIPLAFEQLLRGNVDEAVAALEAAAGQLGGVEGATATVQLTLVLHRAGRDPDTMVAWDHAIEAFREAGAARNEGKALFNRAVILAERGEFVAAEADLSAATIINESLGDEFELAGLAHNRGYVAARQGNLAVALKWFDESQRRMTSLDMQKPEILLDRADTLADAGLYTEARGVIEEAVDVLEARDQHADLAEACLSAARVCVVQGQMDGAGHWARRAREEFERQGRSKWVPVASYYEVLSEPAYSVEHRARLLLEVSESLRAEGWRTTAREADAVAVELLLRMGRIEEAAIPLGRLRKLQRSGTNMDRFVAWTAETRFRTSEGRHLAAGRSMDAAVNALLAHQAGNGSMELRVHGAGRADQAVDMAVLLGRTSHSPTRALGWIERVRSSQEPRGTRSDEELSQELEDLRRVTHRLRSTPLKPGEERRLKAQQGALEELVRRRARHAGGQEGAPFGSLDQLIDELGERLLVEYVRADDRLGAIVIEGGHCRYAELAPTSEVRRAVAGMRMHLAGMVDGMIVTDDDDEPESPKTGRLDRLLMALADVLIDPLELEESAAEAVIVPCGAVGSVPWGALSALGSRPAVVSPSASAWSRAAHLRKSADSIFAPARVVAVCGPGLRHSAGEVDAVRRIWGDAATVLEEDQANVAAVMEALGSADLVHFATHGSFRSDSPLLSALQLSDGPLTGYDLSRLDRVPATIVLSCCETGMTDADSPGTFGLCGLLLASGAASVIASVVPVADENAARLTVPFHRELRANGNVARALMTARAEGEGSDPSGLGFCCFGAG